MELQKQYPEEYACYQTYKERNGYNYCEGLEDVLALMRAYKNDEHKTKSSIYDGMFHCEYNLSDGHMGFSERCKAQCNKCINKSNVTKIF
jgi:hypothetical protein|tara:strand:+ start:204 stop:473 length:270 start_codon:yes stop_codon:yes gene_type:complete